jgi:hypothetical protein
MTYGCYNRPPLEKSYIVFDGYVDKLRELVHTTPVEDRMTRDCQYSKDTVDEGCMGCIRNQREGRC